MTPRSRHGAARAVAAAMALALSILATGCHGGGPQGAGPTGAAPSASPTATSSAASPTAPGGQPTTAGPKPVTPAPKPATPAPGPATPAPGPTSASPGVPAALLGQDITRIPTDRRIVALTFDAGANADGVASILATLARERIRATFFLTGDFVDRYPAAARQVAAAGHRLGNHSVDHPHFPTLSAAGQRAEVLGAQQTIIAATGADPRPFFRFPFGDRTAATISVVNGLGYVAVRWTVDSLGWQGIAEQSVGSVTARVLGAARPGEIVLMHVGSHPTDGSTLDAEALPGVIDGLRQRGYNFVTLDALLGANG
jgi:peptidoglycan/xylan/chitin deacetylase (PgdA/CDA1 family)